MAAPAVVDVDRKLGPQFHRLLAGSAVSNIGDGVSFVVIPLLASTLTDRPELVAGLSTAYALPRLLVAILSGVAVDRFDRRRLMVTVNAARGAVLALLALLVWLEVANIWMLLGVFVVLGLFETLADVSAFSILPAVVAPQHLDRANSRLAGAQTIGDEIAGPPLGGLLFGIAAAVPILFDALTFGVAAVFFSSLRGNFRPADPAAPPRGRRGVLREIGEGVRYLSGQRVLRSLAVLSVITNVAYMLPFSILVLYATKTLDLSPAGYGVVLTVSALGSLLGSVAAPAVRRLLGTTATVGVTLLIGAAAYAVLAVTDSVVLATAMLALYFFYTTIWTITVSSLRQALIPHHLLGRVTGTTRAFSLLGLLAGSLAGGLLAAGSGLRSPFWWAATLLAAAGLAAFPLLKRSEPAAPR
ncbi:MFS transporter [Actinoplanes sp. CA-054009]